MRGTFTIKTTGEVDITAEPHSVTITAEGAIDVQYIFAWEIEPNLPQDWWGYIKQKPKVNWKREGF